MSKTKATKRALLSSVLAMLLCVTMLIGTTFAWFTDTASTAVNKIQAGNLDVALEMYENGAWVSAEGKTLQFKTADGRTNNILWEPGCTYELPALRVVNKGNLALKYKIVITGIAGDAELNKVIDWTIDGITLGNTFTSLAVGANNEFTIKGHMQETAGNEYQGLSIDGIGITVFATQDTVENDSFGNTYDQNAPFVYPAGVTTASFESATSVYYYDTYGGAPYVRVATTADEIQNHPAAVAYVDASGNVCYAADVYCAVANGATTIYCKENATLKVRSVGTNRTEDLTKDLTIYANGANFQYGEIALNSTTAAAQDITVKVYDAKNLYIWGYSPAEGKALTVLMENCHNIGTSETNSAGRMFYISNRATGNGTINATLRNCSVEKSDSPVYMNADGSLTLESCTFTQCAVPVNNNYKSAGTRTDVVEDCKFIRCGCTAEMNSNISLYAAPIRFVKSGTGTLTVTLKNNTFNGTLGTNGDILLGDYRPSKVSKAFEATIVTANSVMVKSSAGTVSSHNGGTVNVLDKNGEEYTLSEFNALTEIPEGIKNVYLNIGAVSLRNGNVTIGNDNIADVYTSVTGNYTVGQELDDGRKIAQVWNASNNIYLANSNKPGITLYVSGSVNENTNAALNSSANYLNFKIPDASKIVFTKDFTVNGYFRMSPSFNDNKNLGGGVAAHKVQSVLFDHSTFNGIWIQNGSFLAGSITLDGCTFNAYENTVSANDSNPLWFCNIRDCDITVQNCTFKASRPIKVVEQGVFGAEVKILNNTFDMSLANTANDASKPKNDAIMFSTITNDSTLGNVEVKGNTVTGATALLTFFNPSQITMANGATFKVSGNTLNGAKISVQWKTATEYIPNFVSVN